MIQQAQRFGVLFGEGINPVDQVLLTCQHRCALAEADSNAKRIFKRVENSGSNNLCQHGAGQEFARLSGLAK